MPTVGDRCQGKDLGRVGHDAKRGYLYMHCARCGEYRWARQYAKRKGGFCRSCTVGRRPSGLKGRSTAGYIIVNLQLGDFFYPMARLDGRIFEHRLVMAKHLSRCLQPWEVVHHINKVKDDNRIQNLELLPSQGAHSQTYHLIDMQMIGRIKQLEKRVTLLEAENILLRETSSIAL